MGFIDERAFQPVASMKIHGHIGEMRCAARCSWDRWSLPQLDLTPEKVKSLTDDTLEGNPSMPKVWVNLTTTRLMV